MKFGKYAPVMKICMITLHGARVREGVLKVSERVCKGRTGDADVARESANGSQN